MSLQTQAPFVLRLPQQKLSGAQEKDRLRNFGLPSRASRI
jgi:hypothetical protein